MYKFCNGNINKFILLLRKSVYPYEYVDSRERFHAKLLPKKEYIQTGLNIEDITNVNYLQASRETLKRLSNKNSR